MADPQDAGSKQSGGKRSGNRKADDNHIIRFEDLNFLGKAVFVGGFLTRAATKAVDATIKASVDIVTEAEKAFKQGLDPNIEDAKILEEHEENRKAKNTPRK
ncbi:MAG: hypothetical protein AAF564_07165 [Bacteroidota bacterium]